MQRPQPVMQRRCLEPAARPDSRQFAIAGGVLAAIGVLLWTARELRA